MQIPLSANPALLVIDMQEGLFRAAVRPFEHERLLANVQRLIAAARGANVPIFAARHTGPAGSPIAPGSPATRILPELQLDIARDHVFDKTRPSCFSGTALAGMLKALGTRDIVLCGMKTEYCIDTTCRVGAELGFAMTLVEDAHATVDSPLLPAHTIIEHHNATLGAFARRARAAEISFQ